MKWRKRSRQTRAGAWIRSRLHPAVRKLSRMLRRVWPRRRSHQVLAASLAGLVVVSAGYYPVSQIIANRQYMLSAQTKKLLGTANAALASKFSYDAQAQSYIFNKKGLDAAAAKNSSDAQAGGSQTPDPVGAINKAKAQLGGAGSKDESLYSVQLPTDPKKGLTYNDNNLDLSFTLTPQQAETGSRRVGDRIVYPLSSGAQAVYTAKSNGLKEDIILNRYISDEVDISYSLKLPDELDARINDDGSLGIYSADPALFGNISYGSSDDQYRVMTARKQAKKDHLVFVLPAPVVKQTGSTEADGVKSYFSLDGNTLKVETSGLSGLHYPVSIDPTVVITSSSEFGTGNNEDNSINYATADQISRGSMTGGSASAGWQYTHNSTNDGSTFVNGFTGTRYGLATVAYNGYIYILGGEGPSSAYNDVQYAPINANGTVGTWQYTYNSASSSSFVGGFSAARYQHTAVAYNGYIYILGGLNGPDYNDVQYAPINANGTVGTWNTTSAFTTARYGHTSVVYNGYLYVIGGINGTTVYNDVQYAPINANGTVGTWNTTSAFTTARYGHTSVVYNGYLYVMGGYDSGVTVYNDVQYAPINANGTVGTWNTTTPFTTARYGHTSVVYNGYLYVMGGYPSSGTTYYNDVQYAPINANGTVGTWVTTSSFTNGRFQGGGVGYEGYVYVLGGDGNSVFYNDVQYAQIDPAGVTGSYTASGVFLSESSKGKSYQGRSGHAAVAYNGNLYILGGYTGSPAAYYYSSVIYAPLNADGSVGTFVSTTSFSTAREYLAAVAYNGYMYIFGGQTGTTAYASDVQYAPINANGTLGSWTATSSLLSSNAAMGAVVYKGYIYCLGGHNASAEFTYVEYAPLNSNGTVGTWQYTYNSTSSASAGGGFSAARYGLGSVVWKGYVYIMGGYSSNMVTNYNDIQYAPINANGTIGTWQYTYNSASSSSFVGGFDTGGPGLSYVVYDGCLYIMGINAANNGTEFVPLNSNGTVGSIITTASSNGGGALYGAAVAYNGYLYYSGGNASGTYETTARYAQINNGGPATTGTWSTTTVLPAVNLGMATQVYNGHIYVMGGYDQSSAYYNTTYYATINADGTLGSWTAGPTFTSGRDYLGSALYNGYLYIIGGYCGSTCGYFNDVQYSKINSDGSLGGWTAGGTFSATAMLGVAATAMNGYLYVTGGKDSAGTHFTTVSYAPINADGSLGTWNTTTAFTTARDLHSAISYNGYLYIIGGWDNTNYFSDVQYAKPNSDGTITSWAYTNSIMVARYSESVSIYKGYMYMLGGYSGAENNDVQYARINGDGTISTWSRTTSFTSARDGQGSVTYDGYAYVYGGSTGSAATTDAQYSPIDVIPRSASYSKLIDLGTTTNVSNISFTGTLGGGKGAISYRLAGTDGVLGASQPATGLTGTCTARGTTRYIWVKVVFDDGLIITYPDSSPGNLLDLTVNYSTGGGVLPGQRLNGGKTLQQGAGLTPLDTEKITSPGPLTCT